VRRRWEAAHVGADLGQQDLSGAPSHPRNGVQVRNRRLHRAQPRSDLGACLLDRLIEEVQVGQLLGEQEPLVRAQPTGKRPLQLRELGAQPTASQLGQRSRVGIASDQPLQHRAGRDSQHVAGHVPQLPA
jgi:hypothetical protein